MASGAALGNDGVTRTADCSPQGLKRQGYIEQWASLKDQRAPLEAVARGERPLASCYWIMDCGRFRADGQG